MPAEAPAIPPKPRTAAINAMTKNVRAQLNMVIPSLSLNSDLIRRSWLAVGPIPLRLPEGKRKSRTKEILLAAKPKLGR